MGRRSTPTRSLADRQLVIFLLAAFVVTWSVGYLAVSVAELGNLGLGLCATVPGIIALVLTRRDHGTIRPLWRQITRWRIAPQWYLAALGIPVGVMGAAAWLTTSFGNAEPSAEGLLTVATMLPFTLLLAGGPEEPGWRGYALPRLQQRFGALGASLVLGATWGLWHGPLWLVPNTGFEAVSYPAYLALALGTSVIYTWLFNSTGGSVLLPMLFHAATNSAIPLLPDMRSGMWTAAALAWGIAAVLLVVHGSRELAGGPRVRRLDSEPVEDVPEGIALR
jgi:uncharacterized protein